MKREAIRYEDVKTPIATCNSVCCSGEDTFVGLEAHEDTDGNKPSKKPLNVSAILTIFAEYDL